MKEKSITVATNILVLKNAITQNAQDNVNLILLWITSFMIVELLNATISAIFVIKSVVFLYIFIKNSSILMMRKI